MQFADVIKSIFSNTTYEKPLSRIYGYKKDNDKRFSIVGSEAQIIKLVIDSISSDSNYSVCEITNNLLLKMNMESIRNRSGKRWTKRTLIGLVRPIYAGIAVSSHGVWRRSKIYPAIVSVESVKKAMRRLKTEKLVETVVANDC